MKKGPLAEIKAEFKGDRADLIPVLQRIQADYDYLPKEAIGNVARWLKISENEIYGWRPSTRNSGSCSRAAPSQVCLGTACHVKGGEQMLEVLKRRLEVNPGETTQDGKYDLERVFCLGCCASHPW